MTVGSRVVPGCAFSHRNSHPAPWLSESARAVPRGRGRRTEDGPMKNMQVQASALGLRRIALLEGLGDDALEALAQRCAWRRYDADQTIISRDADDRSVYFIVAGRVRVMMYSAAGRQVTFNDQAAGEFLGES